MKDQKKYENILATVLIPGELDKNDLEYDGAHLFMFTFILFNDNHFSILRKSF